MDKPRLRRAPAVLLVVGVVASLAFLAIIWWPLSLAAVGAGSLFAAWDMTRPSRLPSEGGP